MRYTGRVKQHRVSQLVSTIAAHSGLALSVLVSSACVNARPAEATVAVESEVRQVVTFKFVPGASGKAVTVFRDHAIPLYRGDEDMLSFRGFREIESPIALDLVVVSAFRSMSGMDRSNTALREAGIGTFYSEVGGLIAEHTDQFVEMLPALGSGDPFTRARTIFVWYRIVPGQAQEFERALATSVVPWERASGVPSASGRFLVSDGWDYLRIFGCDSLGAYQDYWADLGRLPGYARVVDVTAKRREVIVAPVPELAVR